MPGKAGGEQMRSDDLVASPEFKSASRLQRRNVEAHALRVVVLREAVSKVLQGLSLKRVEKDALREALVTVEDRFQREHYLKVDQALGILQQIRKRTR